MAIVLDQAALKLGQGTKDMKRHPAGGGVVVSGPSVSELNPILRCSSSDTPEPGGMTSLDLLWACRALASHLNLVGMDIVEVIPTGVGSADITALVAARVVYETLTGLALARSRKS